MKLQISVKLTRLELVIQYFLSNFELPYVKYLHPPESGSDPSFHKKSTQQYFFPKHQQIVNIIYVRTPSNAKNFHDLVKQKCKQYKNSHPSHSLKPVRRSSSRRHSHSKSFHIEKLKMLIPNRHDNSIRWSRNRDTTMRKYYYRQTYHSMQLLATIRYD